MTFVANTGIVVLHPHNHVLPECDIINTVLTLFRVIVAGFLRDGLIQ